MAIQAMEIDVDGFQFSAYLQTDEVNRTKHSEI